MITNIFLRYKNNEYKFPIGTNILTGKLLRKLIKQFMYETIQLEKYNRIWLGEHYISDDTILIYPDNNNNINNKNNNAIVLFTDVWGVSEEDGLLIPSIVTININDVILNIE